MVKRLTVAQLAGYMRSWSAYVTERKANPTGEDPTIKFSRDLEAVLEAFSPKGSAGEIELVQTLTLIRGSKPRI
jgi:hypothetical protein